MSYTKVGLGACSLSVLLMLGACSAADPGESGETLDASEGASEGVSEAASAYGTGVVVESIEVSDQQTFEVLEYPEGILGMVERQGPDFDPAVAPTMADFRGKSLAELYEHVAGSAAKPALLEKLRASKALSDALRAGQPELEPEVTAEPEPVAELTAQVPSSGARTLALDCAQSEDVYVRYASGWGGQYCQNPPGWENWWCRTNVGHAEKDWTHGERWMIRFGNMSRCNTARILGLAKNGGRQVVLVDHTVPQGSNYWYWWEVSNRDWRWYTRLEHKSGNEYPHLNLATYRQW